MNGELPEATENRLQVQVGQRGRVAAKLVRGGLLWTNAGSPVVYNPWHKNRVTLYTACIRVDATQRTVHCFLCVSFHLRNLVGRNLSPTGAGIPEPRQRGWRARRLRLRGGRFAQ